MIELQKTLDYLNRTGLMMEELNLCLIVQALETDYGDSKLHKAVNSYYRQHTYFDSGNTPINIGWVDIAENLIKKGYLQSGGGHAKQDKQGNFVLELSRLMITDKFRGTIFGSDETLEEYWKEFVNIYGKVMKLGDGSITSTLMPNTAKGEELSDVKRKFWRICEYGNLAACEKVLDMTQQYIEMFGTKRKITNFLDNYQTLIDTMLEQKNLQTESAHETY